MSDAPTGGLLRRLAKASVPPLTPARGLRLALSRAADRSLGLPLAILDIREEEGALDDLLSRLEAGLMSLALRQEGAPMGLIALDGEARAAIIEAQALGRVSATPAGPREPTVADAALARPLLEAFLNEAEAAAEGTPLAGWLLGPALGERVASSREAAILLPDGRYRAVRLTLDLGAGSRQGFVLLLALVAPAAAPADEVEGPTVAPLVLRAQSRVEAVLHRFRLALGDAERLAVGQVLPLPGVTVASVQLEAGGVPLGPGRLGQVAGMRAVRIESPLAPDLAPLPNLAGAGLQSPQLPAEPPWSVAQGEAEPVWPPPDPVLGPDGWPEASNMAAGTPAWPVTREEPMG